MIIIKLRISEIKPQKIFLRFFMVMLPKMVGNITSFFKIYNKISPVRDDSFQAGGGVCSTEPLLKMIDLQS